VFVEERLDLVPVPSAEPASSQPGGSLAFGRRTNYVGTLAARDDLAQLRRQLSGLAESNLGPQLAARVMSLSCPAIRLIRGPAGPAAATGSRLGGDPVTAAGAQWPCWHGEPLHFLALIDRSTVMTWRG